MITFSALAYHVILLSLYAVDMKITSLKNYSMHIKYTQVAFFLFFILLLQTKKSEAQTTLVAGDIAFTGYISSNTTDEFSFVLLKNIVTNTSINFTDNGWTGTAFRTGEGTITWTSNSNYVAGTEIKIVGAIATLAGAGGSAGTINVTTAISLSTSGDQIFAYQGTSAAPIFISGIHMNYWTTAAGDPVNTTAANWDGQASSSVSSALPSSLITGTNAVWIYTASAQHPTEKMNAKFNCTGPLNTLPNLRASVYTFSNWIGDANNTGATFTLPTNCNYLGVTLPIRLLSFNVTQKGQQAEINWKTEDEINLGHYEIQRSLNGRDFVTITTVLPQTNISGTKNYTTIDNDILFVNGYEFYYRLKSVDLDGSYSNSAIVRLLLKDNTISFGIYPNPASNNAVLYSNKKGTGLIRDVTGRVAKKLIILKGANSINLSGFTPGTYFVSIEGTSDVIKLIKL